MANVHALVKRNPGSYYQYEVYYPDQFEPVERYASRREAENVLAADGYTTRIPIILHEGQEDDGTALWVKEDV